jgi:hypothetical protein
MPANAQEKQNPGETADAAPIIKHHINPHGADAVQGSAEKGFSLTTGSTGTVTPAITNHGGPVIGTPTVYVIWYGNWNQSNGSDTPAGQQIVRDFLNSVGGSPYFQINTSYPGVSGNVNFGGETTDTGSRGTRLRDSDILTIVNSAVSQGRLPFDSSGVYFVLTSSNVSESSGFCRTYCGWHTAATTGGHHYRYSFVGNANRCLNGCAAQTTSPNNNAGVDGMVSVVAHELEEATSDPDLNAWYDSQGAENADKCAWTFGHSQYQVSNGSWANMHLGSRDYLIQRNLYHNGPAPSTGDHCQMSSTQN